MALSSKVIYIVDKVENGGVPDHRELEILLKIPPHSDDAGYIMGAADRINRSACWDKAEVHAQIGLNLSPCPRNCSFCAFAAKNGVFKEKTELDMETVIRMGKQAQSDGANAMFMMTTGDYPFTKFIEISSELHNQISPEMVMIANVGDFSPKDAERLKNAGYTGIYHAVRMGEGKDTGISPKTRIKTIRAAQDAGLLIGTCVEPVGPEHSTEEIIEKIIIGRDVNPCFSGAMRRINIPGSELEKYGNISEYRMAFLVAVVRLAMGKHLMGNCTHEPNILGATTGANLFWAEVGTNPRDISAETSEGRGLDVNMCRNFFSEADFDVLQGPSRIFSPENVI